MSIKIEVLNIHKEDRVDFLQSKISSSLSLDLLNYNSFKSLQKRIIISVATRLKIIREIAENNSLTKKLFLLSGEEKVLLSIYIKYSLTSSVCFGITDFHLMSSNFFTLYDKCLESLWFISFSPYFESFSDRNSFGFRPYRRAEDIYLKIKNIFSKKCLTYSVLNFKFRLYLALGLNSQNWFLNSFFCNKGILRSWFIRNVYKNFNVGDETNVIFVNALRYSLSGLV